MNNNTTLSESNQKRIAILQHVNAVPTRYRHLIPDYGDSADADDKLLTWFESAQSELGRLSVQVEAQRLGYLADGG